MVQLRKRSNSIIMNRRPDTPLSNFLLNKIEDFIKPSKYPVQQLTGVIILGGSFDLELESKERNEVLLNSAAERLTKALEIYKKNPRI